MIYPDYQTLSVARDGHLIHLKLDRPSVKNAANSEMELELCSFFRDVNRDPEARVVILSGAGEVFSAGGDFAYMRDLMENPGKSWDGIQLSKQLIFSLLDCVKPVIGPRLRSILASSSLPIPSWMPPWPTRCSPTALPITVRPWMPCWRNAPRTSPAIKGLAVTGPTLHTVPFAGLAQVN